MDETMIIEVVAQKHGQNSTFAFAIKARTVEIAKQEVRDSRALHGYTIESIKKIAVGTKPTMFFKQDWSE